MNELSIHLGEQNFNSEILAHGASTNTLSSEFPVNWEGERRWVCNRLKAVVTKFSGCTYNLFGTEETVKSCANDFARAIFPAVIDCSEMRTGRHQEMMCYGGMNFTCKSTGALGTFSILQVLGWFGYQALAEGATFFYPDIRLTAIRILCGPFGAVDVDWFYPLTRERHARNRRLMEQR
jgi:Na+/melibiose symporter-like transporter